MPEQDEISSPIAIPESLDGCLPIVKKTARFFEAEKAEQERRKRRQLAPPTRPNWSLERQLMLRVLQPRGLYNGRTSSLGDGRLHIVATLRHIDWILRFHEALLRSLKAAGIRITPPSGESKSKVKVAGYGAVLEMSFMEEYERNTKTPGAGEDFNQWTPKNSFKLQLHSPSTKSPKTVRGTMSQLEGALPGLAARVVKWLAEEAERERQRVKAAEEKKAAAAARKIEMDAWFAERQKEQERQALLRERQASRMAQAGRLMEAAKAQAEYLLASEWLERIEAEATDDEAVRAWVSAARAGLQEPFSALLNAVRHEADQAEKPLWWPEPTNPA